MKVVHIITGLNEGGAESALFRLCIRESKNTQVVISLADEGKYGPLLCAAGLQVHCLGIPRGSIKMGALLRLWRLIRSERPDLVQTWMYHADFLGGIVARCAGVATVCWGIRHTTLERGKSKYSTILIAKVCSYLSAFVPTRIICCAREAAEVHADLGYKRSKMVVISNGYDLRQFSPDPLARARLRANLVADERTALIGMVGRFDPQKDHENLIRAVAMLRGAGLQIRCVLVGDGLSASNQQVTEWLDQFELHGTVLLLGQHKDIPSIMNALDVHVLASAFGEAFPNVLAEAMACGTPCVTTDVGAAASIVGETGWVVPPRDSSALAEAISKALDDRRNTSAWAERQRAARERIVDNFSIEKMVDAYHVVWREAVARCGRSAPRSIS